MAFRVEIAPRAFDDLDEIADYIKKRGSFESARQWFNGILDAIAALNEMSLRCPIVEESEALGQDVRLLLYGRHTRRYQIYYSVHDETHTVRVFHVRHWARRDLEAEDLRQLTNEPVAPEDDREQ